MEPDEIPPLQPTTPDAVRDWLSHHLPNHSIAHATHKGDPAVIMLSPIDGTAGAFVVAVSRISDTAVAKLAGNTQT